MKRGDKVLISYEDGDIGSINATGIIISSAQSSNDVPARHCVKYEDNKNWPIVSVNNWFLESDLKKID
jgi:hypothetical protein